MAFYPRPFRRLLLRRKIILLTLVIILCLDAWFITSSHPKPTRIRKIARIAPSLREQKVFIVSIHRNSEYMLRLYWNSALLDLVKKLGIGNVFVSIVESGSYDDTKGALIDLEMSLNDLEVDNRVSLGQTSEEQIDYLMTPPEGESKPGWIFTGRGDTGWELRRIPHLAETRNRAMKPLTELISAGEKFDKVLWINDVVFTAEDVMTILSTRGGNYAAACALDFSKDPESYYDTFALRDSQGYKTATLTYPYFHSSSSLSPLYHLAPIPVKSCWNGLIAMSAAPFYHTPPLNFRGVSDSLAKEHIEGSECCLIHSDNFLSHEKGVWLNPNVRVAYNATTYSKVNGGVEVRAAWGDPPISDGVIGGDGSYWPGKGEMWRGVWMNRFARWTGWMKVWSENRVVRKRVENWVNKGKMIDPPETREEKGLECLVNEMQVLVYNGWQHV